MQQPGDRFYICEMQTNVGLDCGMGHQEEKQQQNSAVPPRLSIHAAL